MEVRENGIRGRNNNAQNRCSCMNILAVMFVTAAVFHFEISVLNFLAIANTVGTQVPCTLFMYMSENRKTE